jgi:Domain of unknown function (DUF1735)
MKNIFLKITGFIALAAMVFLLPSCLKENKATFTDFSTTTETVILQNSGLGNFKAANISPTSADTIRIELVAQLNSEYTIGSDINVSLDVDDAKRTAYNTVNNKTFLLMTADMYKIISKKLVIKAGKRIDLTYVEIYTAPINAQTPDKSWMLPISITDASGKPLTTNFNTMYVNVIGNPLAGKYDVVGTRFNYTGFAAYSGPPAPIPTPVSTTNLAGVKVASPIDGQTITMSFSNLGFGTGFEYGYLVTGNANFSAITLDYNTEVLTNNSKIVSYLVSYTPPSPTQKPAFKFITHYNNNATGTGNDRIIEETFTHQ